MKREDADRAGGIDHPNHLRSHRSNGMARPGRGNRTSRTNRLFLISAATLLVLPVATPAHAYLDPGTGSMILQVILGGVAGLVVAGKLYWKRVKEFFGRSSGETATSASESANDPTVD